MVLKPIETRYRGYRFRSRLEARWAVFFDALGVPYQYEPQGFDLSVVRERYAGHEDGPGWIEEVHEAEPLAGRDALYLPDFWLPAQRCWIEVKGASPSDAETARAHALAAASGHDVFIFFGEVWLPDEQEGLNDSAYKHFAQGGWDNQYWWCECAHCGLVGIEYEGRSARLPCNCAEQHADPVYGRSDRDHNYESPRLVAAYTAARQARFEHGERGAPR